MSLMLDQKRLLPRVSRSLTHSPPPRQPNENSKFSDDASQVLKRTKKKAGLWHPIKWRIANHDKNSKSIPFYVLYSKKSWARHGPTRILNVPCRILKPIKTHSSDWFIKQCSSWSSNRIWSCMQFHRAMTRTTPSKTRKSRCLTGIIHSLRESLYNI